MRLLLATGDYEQDRISHEDLIYTCVVIYLAHWVMQGIFYIFLMLLGGDIWKNHRNRDIISRLAVDTFAMLICTILGYEAFVDLGGFSGLTKGSAYERLYLYNPSSQRLLLFQMGYTFKTIGDALIYNDGVISFVHHTATGFVVGLALYPFLHTYASFYVGLSELSTIFLCIVIAFQKERGVEQLQKKYPLFDTLNGVLFAVLFLFCRILLWGYYTWHFWFDCLEVLSSNTAHSVLVVVYYLVANTGLSILQLYWLNSILKAVFDLFGPSKAKKV